MISRCLVRRRIDACLERFDADAAEGVDEALTVLALGEIDIENALDDRGDVGVRHRRPDHLADGGIDAAGGSAERDLVPLLATLIDAENADVADVMMAASVHATGHLELDIAQIVEIVQI